MYLKGSWQASSLFHRPVLGYWLHPMRLKAWRMLKRIEDPSASVITSISRL
jgi:hypothetical protein